MKTKLLVGNWKMNLGISASLELAAVTKSASAALSKSELWVTPSFLAIPAVASALKGTQVKVGAQNVHGAEKGAYTGELSVAMLKEVGCTFALTGHSERRHQCGESDALVIERTLGALKSGLTIILCVGEKLEERTSGTTISVIEKQIAALFPTLTADLSAQLLIAYEPVWAIGTGKVASLTEIEETHRGIQQLWKKFCNFECPAILYGGSVDPDNIAAITSIESVAGCLIGGASINPAKLQAMVSIVES